ncbi:SDR family oxidoreductase [Streptomyces sp. NBC_01220]|uniref:SDR family NAD(P)-dependent oxidoreductase n=1 Tax=unclassified Streptomyces TaxID=2593676 RepID=UPI002E2956EA|nr:MULTISPECIES: SDR family oxidoreductase [unclassified Streptomyces]WSQ45773.1 SDR family oxidoreductase [Streptomyces sp. NBC_01220]
MPVNFDVSGKHVLITGGRGGIGGAIATAFVEAGAHVIATDLAPLPEKTREGIEDRMLDVRDADAVRALAGELTRLDVLVQCAGRAAPMEEYELATFEEIVGIHLTGTFSVATALQPLLAASGGSVINVGSMYSYFGSPLVPAYGAAKAGIVQLTKTLALAWAAEGVRVNGIAPGWIRTALTAPLEALPGAAEAIVSRIPGGQLSEPEELAGTALFLASPAARLINGVTIPVDGGYSAG